MTLLVIASSLNAGVLQIGEHDLRNDQVASFPSTEALGPGKTSSSIEPNSECASLNGDTVLDVEVIDHFHASIRNIGNADAINVKWEISFECLLLIISPGQSGNIDRIKVDSQEVVPNEVNDNIFGFGFLKQKAIAYADNADKVSDVELIGFLFGPVIFIFP